MKPEQEIIPIPERRQHYRKRLRAVGYVIHGPRTCEFNVQDLSLDGLRAYFKGDPLLEPGNIVRIRLPSLHLEGTATLIRLSAVGKGRYSAGFCFNSSSLRPTTLL